MWPSSVFWTGAPEPEPEPERPPPPVHAVEFTAACDVCGEAVTWFGGVEVMKDPNGHGTLTVSRSWNEHCAELAA